MHVDSFTLVPTLNDNDLSAMLNLHNNIVQFGELFVVNKFLQVNFNYATEGEYSYSWYRGCL